MGGLVERRGEESKSRAMGTEAGTGSGGGPMSHLPLQLIPRFVPGTTNVDEYVKRLQFLKEMWPEEHLQLLGPRAALLVEGAAFQKVSGISPEKLKSPDGVNILAEQLGGSWGRLQVEDKFHYFEQAILQTQQKHDETNDSYIARHDAQFEELLSRKVGLEEVRVYVLLRHSQLAPEDKKRVIIESKGDLKYAETIKAIRLLGSRFFGDLQSKSGSQAGASKGPDRTVDLSMAEAESTEDIHMAAQEDEIDEDEVFAFFFEQCDEDALYIAEFEDGIIEAVQESNKAPAFSAYQEARQRLRDKARARGFWSVGKGANKGRGKSNGKKERPGGWSASGYGKGKRPRTPAERISTSSCRLCGAVGHWKRECPRNTDNQNNNGKLEISNRATAGGEDGDDSSDPPPEFLHDLPEDAVMCMDELSLSDDRAQAVTTQAGETVNLVEHYCFVSPEVKPSRCT